MCTECRLYVYLLYSVSYCVFLRILDVTLCLFSFPMIFFFFLFFLLRVFACIFSGVEQQISTGFLLKLTSKINQQGGYNITR